MNDNPESVYSITLNVFSACTVADYAWLTLMFVLYAEAMQHG